VLVNDNEGTEYDMNPMKPTPWKLNVENDEMREDLAPRWVIRASDDTIVATFAMSDHATARDVVVSVNVRNDIVAVLDDAHEFVADFVDGAPDAGLTARTAATLEAEIAAIARRVRRAS
jgi:hypothetical protein